MPSIVNPPIKPHYHSIQDLPVGQGPDKLALWEDTIEIPTGTFVPGSAGAAAMGPYDRIALCDTTLGAIILYAPPVADGFLTVKIIAGILPVQVTPNVPTEGVDGTAGATYIVDPAIDDSAQFVGNVADGVWELVT